MNKSLEQVKADFSRKGVSIASWAMVHGVSRNLVYQVLNGGRQCRYGQSHKIAVLLGLKDGVIEDEGSINGVASVAVHQSTNLAR